MLSEEVEIKTKDSMLIILPTAKKTLEWYLEGYDDESDRYDWSGADEPMGREML